MEKLDIGLIKKITGLSESEIEKLYVNKGLTVYNLNNLAKKANLWYNPGYDR